MVGGYCVLWLERFIKPGETPVPSAEELARRVGGYKKELARLWKRYDVAVNKGAPEAERRELREQIRGQVLKVYIGER